jgi:hypothetical protein
VSTLDAQACYSSGGTQYLLCKPTTLTDSSQFACSLPTGVDASAIPACSASIGTFTYSVGTSTIGTIDSDNNTITAAQPGTTVITAAIAGSGSSAGYFSTCPPKTISVVLANGGTSGTVTKGATQNLTTVITDTNGNTITGLSLDYQSTNPIDLSVTSAGAITSKYPGVADVNAVCQPSTCNPAPINKLGFNGTGLSVSHHTRHGQRVCLVCGSRPVPVFCSHSTAHRLVRFQRSPALRSQFDEDGCSGHRPVFWFNSRAHDLQHYDQRPPEGG